MLLSNGKEDIRMKNSKRKALLGVLIIVVLVLCIGLFPKNKTNTLNTTSINKETTSKELDDNLIGAYIQNGDDYTPTSDIPTSGYEFNAEKSYCKIGDAIQEDMTLSYDMDTQTLTVSPIAEEGTKCYLYFDEKASGGDYILAGDNPPTNSTTDWTGETTYYYTGNPNNWVQFAGFWWRIIRINGDGSIRMIYQGTSANTTGTGTQIGTSDFNSSYNNNMYVGFKYTSGQVHGTGTNSTILNTLNTWYQNNLADEAEYIDRNAGFCGDRTPSTSSSSSNGSGGTGTTTTYYGAYIRLDNKGTSNSNPSLQCDSQDVYTTTDSSSGNKSLQYPIGLVTADEAALTGITYNNANTGSYLYTGQAYWTMSPNRFSSGYAYVFLVISDGYLNGYRVNNTWGVRPVINLKSAIAISGSGTTGDPYTLSP